MILLRKCHHQFWTCISLFWVRVKLFREYGTAEQHSNIAEERAKEIGASKVVKNIGVSSGTGHWRLHVCSIPVTNQCSKGLQHHNALIPSGPCFMGINANTILQSCKHQLRVFMAGFWKGQCTRSLYLSGLWYQVVHVSWVSMPTLSCRAASISWGFLWLDFEKANATGPFTYQDYLHHMLF